MSEINYRVIVDHYEGCLAKFGDNHLGVDWPNALDAAKRYKIMLDILPYNQGRETPSLLDFGCGTAGLLEFMKVQSLYKVDYSGLDISDKFTAVSKTKFPDVNFYTVDILKDEDVLPQFDFTIMNGVFTEKRALSFDEMFRYFKSVLKIVYNKTRVGIAFNVMSKHVDWERDDLFHLPHDLLAEFLTKEISRHYIIRNDYGLYEYTVYVFKNQKK